MSKSDHFCKNYENAYERLFFIIAARRHCLSFCDFLKNNIKQFKGRVMSSSSPNQPSEAAPVVRMRNKTPLTQTQVTDAFLIRIRFSSKWKAINLTFGEK